MPSPLEALQKAFTASVIGDADPGFVAAVEGGGKLTSAEAVEGYRNAYPARMTEALGETFEACWRVLGDEDFLEACRVYARSTPSASYNLSDYGSSFPEYLKERFGGDAPFIGDLGRLEWEFKNIFHAEPHAGLAPPVLSAAVKGNSVLVFGAAAVLLSFDHKVHDLWKRDRDNSALLERADWEGAQHALLYKNEGSAVLSRVLSARDAAALNFLREGRPLGEALAAVEGLDEEAVHDLFSFIAAAGLVTEVR